MRPIISQKKKKLHPSELGFLPTQNHQSNSIDALDGGPVARFWRLPFFVYGGRRFAGQLSCDAVS
jgi:hypothetical protein